MARLSAMGGNGRSAACRTTALVVVGPLASLALLGCGAEPSGGPPDRTTVTAVADDVRERPPAPVAEPTSSAAPTDGPAALDASAPLYLNPDTQARAAYDAAAGAERDLLGRIALTPQAFWVGDWYAPGDITAVVADYTGRAAAADAVPALVVYAIPGRDCGLYSAGGVATSEYAGWVDAVAAGLEGAPLVVLEPDALASLGDCDGQGDRVGYLRDAAEALTAAGARVYVDVGHSGWLPVETAAERLRQVGVADYAGFALNTSNYQATADERAYGEAISAALGGDVGFVVDTSRNGNGSDGQWCNPRGRALGDAPHLVADDTHLDALLWVKAPGESDGECNGGPPAGQWWPEIALELARNAG